jgi:hypothetical protein
MYVRLAVPLALLSLSVVAAGQEARPAQEIVVAQDGDDTNPGTFRQPLATLQRAQELARRRIAAGLEAPLRVSIRQGVYELPAPLSFGPQDSGTADCPVTWAAYPGETVVLSGGREIRAWKSGPGPSWPTGPQAVWRATLPEALTGQQSIRALFVGGQRLVRARQPDRAAPPERFWRLRDVDFQPEQTRYTLHFDPGVVQAWQHPEDVEVMIAGIWEINRKRALAVDPAQGTVELAPPHYRGPGHAFPTAGRWGYFENAREFLDQPGEWYLERSTGTVWFWPPPGLEPGQGGADAGAGSGVAVAPVSEALIVVTGAAPQPVRHLHFRGLQLSYTRWPLPAAGFMGTQACHFSSAASPEWRWNHIPAAVRFSYAENCSMQDCTLAHLGGCGIDLSDGCRDNLLQGNHLFDISGNGVMVGVSEAADAVPQRNQLSENDVHTCGVEFHGGVGIWVGIAQDTTVARNLVHDLPYTGISVGWEWGPTPTSCKGNVIERNHVYDVLNLLCDGGAIYTLGLQPGTVVRNNRLHAVHRSLLAGGAPNNGIFFDEGSTGFVVEGNTIYDTAGEPLRFNQCSREGHTWGENALGTLRRRLLYNLDGSGCLINKKGSMGPARITVEDLHAAVREVAYPGSQLDTLLVCINAQCTYYPSKVGTLYGSLRVAGTPDEDPFLRNLEAFYARGTDPYAELLDNARAAGLEALLSYRMNDAHDGKSLRCKLWADHPECRLGNGLDFAQEAVREYTFRIIEEAVGRYDCDGIELDFNRFPKYFAAAAGEEQLTQISGLVQRVRQMLDTAGKARGRRLVLAARVPTSYEHCRQLGLDPVAWATNGWLDFLTVSEFLHTRYDLPVQPWKEQIKGIPVYASIECADGPGLPNFMNPEKYRRAARHVWSAGADGVYLFNFFCSREYGAQSFEPPFELLRELGDPRDLRDH